MTKIYLCGPIAGCNDNEAHDWRDWVTAQNKDWAECLDPMRRDYRGKGLADKNDVMPDHIVKEIVELDKIDIMQSDVLLANMLPDKSKTGSNMEIIYAFERGKLTVIVVPEGLPVSPWHRYHAQKIVHTLDDALEYIQHGNWTNKEVFANEHVYSSHKV
jgi:hypothetical protein